MSPRRAVQGPGQGARAGPSVIPRRAGGQYHHSQGHSDVAGRHQDAPVRFFRDHGGGSPGPEHRPPALWEEGEGGLSSWAPEPHTEAFASQGCPCRGQPSPPTQRCLPGAAHTRTLTPQATQNPTRRSDPARGTGRFPAPRSAQGRQDRSKPRMDPEEFPPAPSQGQGSSPPTPPCKTRGSCRFGGRWSSPC